MASAAATQVLSSPIHYPWVIGVYWGQDLPITLTRSKTLSPEPRPLPLRGGSSPSAGGGGLGLVSGGFRVR